MPVIIIGGILGGIFTAPRPRRWPSSTPSSSDSHHKKLTLRNLPRVVVQSALVTSAALLIVSMASLFANILTVIRSPDGRRLHHGHQPRSHDRDDDRGDLPPDLRHVHRHAARGHHPGARPGPLADQVASTPYTSAWPSCLTSRSAWSRPVVGPLHPHNRGSAELREASLGLSPHAYGVRAPAGFGDGHLHPGDQLDLARWFRFAR